MRAERRHHRTFPVRVERNEQSEDALVDKAVVVVEAKIPLDRDVRDCLLEFHRVVSRWRKVNDARAERDLSQLHAQLGLG